MLYNSYLMVTLPAKMKSLPVLPAAKVDKQFLRPQTQGNRCLELVIRYRSEVPYGRDAIRAFYEQALLQQGWKKRPASLGGLPSFSKGTLTVDIFTTTQKSLWLRVTFLVFPIFQPGCFQ
jgi:hypothetical protein